MTPSFPIPQWKMFVLWLAVVLISSLAFASSGLTVCRRCYLVPSERRLMEQISYNLLFRWFVGLNMDDPIWGVTLFINLNQTSLS